MAINEIHIKHSVIQQLSNVLQGTVTKNHGEEILEFNTKEGKGKIRSISFDWGITLLDYDVFFNENFQLLYKLKKEATIEFLFVSEGKLKHNHAGENSYTDLESLQNIIISNKSSSENIYLFLKHVRVKLNIIQVTSHKYLKKKNNTLNSLQTSFLSLFKYNINNLSFKHLGSYNLEIAQKIKDLNNAKGVGAVRFLYIEGQLNLILSLQMLEYYKFLNRDVLPNALSKNDIDKIKKAADYIKEDIPHNVSVKMLSRKFGLSPGKLQLGFKFLYSKSVNEYIRQTKLELAMDLIKNSEMLISEIVYSIGYKSRSYFSKIFYDSFSILPTHYRDKLKKTSKLKQNSSNV